MDLDTRYAVTRDKLYSLGFEQPLPIGSLAIVTALLDELVQTSANLKQSQTISKQLQEQKVAWDLGNAPYKCDNSRLLSECNTLHLEIIKQRDTFRMKIVDLNRIVRTLEVDKQHLEEHCAELCNKIRDLESRLNDTKAGGAKQKSFDAAAKRPFISTVRSGTFFPAPATTTGPPSTDDLLRCCRCCKCSASATTSRLNVWQTDMQRLQIENRTQADTIDELKKQVEAREREMSRLNQLLIGGRPAAAVGKDCCYRGIATLADDVDGLQREKLALQQQLKETVCQQHEAMQRALQLAQQNQQLEHSLREMEGVALQVESEANHKFSAHAKERSKLEARLDTSLMRIAQLEADRSNLKVTRDMENDRIHFRNTLATAQAEIVALKEKNRLQLERDGLLVAQLEKYKQKIAKIRSQINLQHSGMIKTMANQRAVAAERTDAKVTSPKDSTGHDKLKNDRDFYQREYEKLLNRPTYEHELQAVKSRLAAKERQLELLQNQSKNSHQSEPIVSSRSVQSAINRAQRENDLLRSEMTAIQLERDNLRDRLQAATEMQKSERIRSECEQQSFAQRIAQLESKNNELLAGHAMSTSSSDQVRKELAFQKEQLRDAQAENSKLRTSLNQYKILQEQSDKALQSHQNRLSHTANQLGAAESQLDAIDSSRDQAYKETSSLRVEIGVLKAMNNALEREKDQMMADLDIKTERVFGLEADVAKLRVQNMDMQNKTDAQQRQIDDVTSDRQHKEGTLRKASSETEKLRQQVAQLNRLSDNALAENRRLESELSDAESSHTETRLRLRSCESEVDRLKNQLQQYVQEVQKAEDLLYRKEEEREEMLEHYKSLSQDAVALEGNNHSLEAEAADARRCLVDAEAKIGELHDQLVLREGEIRSYERQVAELSGQMASNDEEIERCHQIQATIQADLDATKELCTKLDHQKDKINAELNECSVIRRKLEEENEKLRQDMTVGQSGDKATVDSLQNLLSAARKEVEQQRRKESAEVDRLRRKIDELQKRLAEERANVARGEVQSKEYAVQIEELRQRLTDDRFAKSTSKESREDYDRSNEKNTVLPTSYLNYQQTVNELQEIHGNHAMKPQYDENNLEWRLKYLKRLKDNMQSSEQQERSALENCNISMLSDEPLRQNDTQTYLFQHDQHLSLPQAFNPLNPLECSSNNSVIDNYLPADIKISSLKLASNHQLEASHMLLDAELRNSSNNSSSIASYSVNREAKELITIHSQHKTDSGSVESYHSLDAASVTSNETNSIRFIKDPSNETFSIHSVNESSANEIIQWQRQYLRNHSLGFSAAESNDNVNAHRMKTMRNPKQSSTEATQIAYDTDAKSSEYSKSEAVIEGTALTFEATSKQILMQHNSKKEMNRKGIQILTPSKIPQKIKFDVCKEKSITRLHETEHTNHAGVAIDNIESGKFGSYETQPVAVTHTNSQEPNGLNFTVVVRNAVAPIQETASYTSHLPPPPPFYGVNKQNRFDVKICVDPMVDPQHMPRIQADCVYRK